MPVVFPPGDDSGGADGVADEVRSAGKHTSTDEALVVATGRPTPTPSVPGSPTPRTDSVESHFHSNRCPTDDDALSQTTTHPAAALSSLTHDGVFTNTAAAETTHDIKSRGKGSDRGGVARAVTGADEGDASDGGGDGEGNRKSTGDGGVASGGDHVCTESTMMQGEALEEAALEFPAAQDEALEEAAMAFPSLNGDAAKESLAPGLAVIRNDIAYFNSTSFADAADYDDGSSAGHDAAFVSEPPTHDHFSKPPCRHMFCSSCLKGWVLSNLSTCSTHEPWSGSCLPCPFAPKHRHTPSYPTQLHGHVESGVWPRTRCALVRTMALPLPLPLPPCVQV